VRDARRRRGGARTPIRLADRGFQGFSSLARRDDDAYGSQAKEEQRRETKESRRKATGANLFGVLGT